MVVDYFGHPLSSICHMSQVQLLFHSCTGTAEGFKAVLHHLQTSNFPSTANICSLRCKSLDINNMFIPGSSVPKFANLFHGLPRSLFQSDSLIQLV